MNDQNLHLFCVLSDLRRSDRRLRLFCRSCHSRALTVRPRPRHRAHVPRATLWILRPSPYLSDFLGTFHCMRFLCCCAKYLDTAYRSLHQRRLRKCISVRRWRHGRWSLRCQRAWFVYDGIHGLSVRWSRTWTSGRRIYKSKCKLAVDVLYTDYVGWDLIPAVVILVPETYHPLVLKGKAAKLRNDTGEKAHYTTIERHEKSILRTIALSCLHPIQLLTLEPMCIALCVFSAVLLGILYLFFWSLPFGVWQKSRLQLTTNWSDIPWFTRRHARWDSNEPLLGCYVPKVANFSPQLPSASWI